MLSMLCVDEDIFCPFILLSILQIEEAVRKAQADLQASKAETEKLQAEVKAAQVCVWGERFWVWAWSRMWM